MKTTVPAILATLLALLATSCDQAPSETARQLSELKQQAALAVERQQDLERQLHEQQLTVERDAIERERMQIEQDRLAQQREQSENAEAATEKILLREQKLALREGQLDQLQNSLEEQQTQLADQSGNLSEREQELAGREALDTAGSDNQEAPVGDLNTFYDSLSSYGSWFETDDYGYVWQPAVVRDRTWRPYVRGRWACTDRGWNWISDEPFGWATYHYGRWCLLSGRGWIWVPGTVWAPSWVTWRYCDNYVGWAPLPPETLAYSGNRWGASVEVSFGIGASWFNFVRVSNLCYPVRYHCLPYTHNSVYIDNSVNITNIYTRNRRVICGGPRYRDVYRRGPRPVPFYRLDTKHTDHPSRGALAMRPRVHGDRLQIASPSRGVARNPSGKPRHISGRLESIKVERARPLSQKITRKFSEKRNRDRKASGQIASARRQSQPLASARPANPAATPASKSPAETTRASARAPSWKKVAGSQIQSPTERGQITRTGRDTQAPRTATRTKRGTTERPNISPPAKPTTKPGTVAQTKRLPQPQSLTKRSTPNATPTVRPNPTPSASPKRRSPKSAPKSSLNRNSPTRITPPRALLQPPPRTNTRAKTTVSPPRTARSIPRVAQRQQVAPRNTRQAAPRPALNLRGGGESRRSAPRNTPQAAPRPALNLRGGGESRRSAPRNTPQAAPRPAPRQSYTPSRPQIQSRPAPQSRASSQRSAGPARRR